MTFSLLIVPSLAHTGLRLMKPIRFIAAVASFFLAFGAFAQAPAPKEELINFSLLDYKGRYHELRRLNSRVLVLFFTENGCPVARQSIEKLRDLRKRYSDDELAVWLIDANTQDDPDSIEKEARDFKFGSLPVLIDDTQEIARMLGVKRSAETVCIDTSNSVVFYRGAFDNQLAEGAQKPDATEHYVDDAFEQFLAGKPVALTHTVSR